MPEYKIEKGVPLPPDRQKGLLHTLRRMKVGDSIVIASIANIHNAAVKANISIAARTQKDGTVRVWCTAKPRKQPKE